VISFARALVGQKVGGFLSTSFRVVHGHLCAFCYTLAHGLPSVCYCMAGELEGLLCVISTLDNDGLGRMIHFLDRSMENAHHVLSRTKVMKKLGRLAGFTILAVGIILLRRLSDLQIDPPGFI
jgi:hypothetical protein